MEWADWARLLPAGGYGLAVGIMLLVMWLVLTDRLVSRRRLLDVTADRDQWRKTAEKHDARADELLEQKAELMRQLGIVEPVIRALPSAPPSPGPKT